MQFGVNLGLVPTRTDLYIALGLGLGLGRKFLYST